MLNMCNLSRFSSTIIEMWLLAPFNTADKAISVKCVIIKFACIHIVCSESWRLEQILCEAIMCCNIRLKIVVSYMKMEIRFDRVSVLLTNF